jgi:hypothetical protein
MGDGSAEGKESSDGLNMKEVSGDLLEYLKEIAPSF